MGVVSWLFWKKRRSTHNEERKSMELEKTELGGDLMRHELNATRSHHELDVREDDSMRHELNAPHGHQELDVKKDDRSIQRSYSELP